MLRRMLILLVRFIPTGVGNTMEKGRAESAKTVHPHGCGEHLFCRMGGTAGGGSSPRVWGTRPRPQLIQVFSGFIPTGVGNTLLLQVVLSSRAVHPHGCGEHVFWWCSGRYGSGSSPRVWGTLKHHTAKAQLKRFIPTGVGNTNSGFGLLQYIAVHPHGCGEHLAGGLTLAMASGSSPRVWGTLSAFVSAIFKPRFIPTGVGNTLLYYL